MQRRDFLQTVLLASAASLIGTAPATAYEVTKSDAEWRKILSPEAYEVLRHADTEAPWNRARWNMSMAQGHLFLRRLRAGQFLVRHQV